MSIVILSSRFALLNFRIDSHMSPDLAKAILVVLFSKRASIVVKISCMAWFRGESIVRIHDTQESTLV